MKNYWKNKKVIVAGGLGFLGSHFIDELIRLGADVVCISRTGNKKLLSDLGLPSSRAHFKQIDLLNYPKVKKGFEKADLIINCAALDGNTEFKMKHAAQMMDVNVRIASNILNVAREKNVKNVVLASTAEIYSSNVASPIVEEDDHAKYNDYTGNGYVLSKRYAEILGSLYEQQYGMNVFLPRPTNIYGPRDHFEDKMGRVIPSMIKKVFKGEAIEIWGDGSQVRQFIYVKDATSSIFKMVETNKYHKLNIASGEAISILKLAKLITEIIGAKERIQLDKDKPIGVKSRVLDTTKLDSIIDFRFKSLEEGLRELINWYRKKILKK